MVVNVVVMFNISLDNLSTMCLFPVKLGKPAPRTNGAVVISCTLMNILYECLSLFPLFESIWYLFLVQLYVAAFCGCKLLSSYAASVDRALCVSTSDLVVVAVTGTWCLV